MGELRRVKEIFDKIANVNSKKSKETIIKQNKDNKLFLFCLKFLLDSNITTGLSKKKINKKVQIYQNTYSDIRDMFRYLSLHNSGTDINIGVVQGYINSLDEDLQDFVRGLLTKSLKIGADAKTVNRVIPGLIPVHDIMLANKYEGKIKEDVSMSLKMDGIRNSIITVNGITKALSRQGKEIDGIDYILDEYEELGLTDYFVDGELIRVNKENLSSDENFRLTTKIVNSKSNNKEGLEFIVFDITPMEDYINKKSSIKYKNRLKLMDELIGDKGKHIKLVEKFGITNDTNIIEEKLNEVIKNGQEGLILNTLNGKYEFGKRPKSLLKVKKFNEADVLCVGINEGEGRLKSTTGSLVCKFLYKGEECTVEIGTGLSDSDRRTIFNNSELVVGKVITIRYFEVSKDSKTGKYSLRFPSWKGMVYIRSDKSTLEETNID